MFKVFITILALLFIPLQGQNYCLRESLQQAEAGNYVVYESARFYTMLFVRSKKQNLITIEEISVAEGSIASMKRGSAPFDFPLWLKEGAMNSSSWITYTADLGTGRLLKSYSHVRKSEQAPSPILSTLLNLPCGPATPRKLTKKGMPWNPPLPLGDQVLHNDTHAWMASWPTDGSPLASAKLIIYTADAPLLPLPYWIEMCKDQKRILMRAVASGK